LGGLPGRIPLGRVKKSQRLARGGELGHTRGFDSFDRVRLRVCQETIELTQIRRLDRDHGGCRKLDTLLGGGEDGVDAQRLVLGQQPTQRVIHRRLALAGRVLQDPQVLAGAHRRRVLRAQPIVGLAKTAVGEQILAIPIILKGARFAHQLVDDVPIVDGVLVASHQSRQRVHATSRVPDFHAVRIQSSLDLLANQAAVHRVHVAMNVDQTSPVHRHRQT